MWNATPGNLLTSPVFWLRHCADSDLRTSSIRAINLYINLIEKYFYLGYGKAVVEVNSQ
jgi:hypothetical protein